MSDAEPKYIEEENDDFELVDPDEIYFDDSEWDDDTDWSEEDWDEED